jgi:hypothetical protein
LYWYYPGGIKIPRKKIFEGDFDKDPAKYLKKIQDAAAAQK